MSNHKLSVTKGDLAISTTSKTTERELETLISKFAYYYGWNYRRQYAVDGWGQMDLIIHHGQRFYGQAIELKLALKTPAKLRDAFQQAETYSRHLRTQHDANPVVWLVGREINFEISGELEYAYADSVKLLTVGELMGRLSQIHPEYGEAQLQRARERAEWAVTGARVAQFAFNELKAQQPKKKKVNA